MAYNQKHTVNYPTALHSYKQFNSTTTAGAGASAAAITIATASDGYGCRLLQP